MSDEKEPDYESVFLTLKPGEYVEIDGIVFMHSVEGERIAMAKHVFEYFRNLKPRPET